MPFSCVTSGQGVGWIHQVAGTFRLTPCHGAHEIFVMQLLDADRDKVWHHLDICARNAPNRGPSHVLIYGGLRGLTASNTQVLSSGSLSVPRS